MITLCPHSSPHASPHALLLVYYIMLPTRRISSAGDFDWRILRGGFLPRRISSAADFFRGFRWPSVINYTSDVIGVICRIWGAVIQLAMPPWLCFKCLFTLPVSCVMFQKSVNKSTPNFCTPSRDNDVAQRPPEGPVARVNNSYYYIMIAIINSSYYII